MHMQIISSFTVFSLRLLGVAISFLILCAVIFKMAFQFYCDFMRIISLLLFFYFFFNFFNFIIIIIIIIIIFRNFF